MLMIEGLIFRRAIVCVRIVKSQHSMAVPVLKDQRIRKSLRTTSSNVDPIGSDHHLPTIGQTRLSPNPRGSLDRDRRTSISFRDICQDQIYIARRYVNEITYRRFQPSTKWHAMEGYRNCKSPHYRLET